VAEAPHTDTEKQDDLWHTMNRTTRDELHAEDSEAWQGVVGILLFIVSIGLVLAVLTLWLSRS
jgi:hypothetical protein